MSVGCGTVAVSLQLTFYASNIPNAVCASPPAGEQVMLETFRGPLILNKVNEKCIKLVQSYYYTIMHGQQNIKIVIA
jgi:hypothetical protein